MNIKPSRELIFLIAGAILVIGGIVGAGIVLGSGEKDTSKEQYFASQTAISATSEVATATAAAMPSLNVTPTATIPGVVKGNQIDANAYLVHVDPSTGLESPNIPDRIVIPAIKLDAPVVMADFNYTDVEGETFGQWMAPSQYGAGWHPNSALLGQVGNTVINGHHNEYGEVFKDIVNLEIGDEIYVYSKEKKFSYVVANEPMRLLELYQNVETRLNNARWLAKTDDERLTLVTCWPPLSNTYRVIVVARPQSTGE
jgi:sortase A